MARGRPPGTTPADIFDDAILRADGCMEWPAALTNQGYAQLSYKMKGKRVHKFFYEEVFFAPVPKGMHLHHICERRWCVNPMHLRLMNAGDHSRMHFTGKKMDTSARTHCKNGHEYTPDNLLPRADGPARRCKTCRRAIDARRVERDRAARLAAKP